VGSPGFGGRAGTVTNAVVLTDSTMVATVVTATVEVALVEGAVVVATVSGGSVRGGAVWILVSGLGGGAALVHPAIARPTNAKLAIDRNLIAPE
jgi:hypothetical protein